MGTRFIATDESGAHPDYKQAVVDATAGSTAISDAFAICPLCATSPRPRVLRRCISAVRAFENDVVGEATMAGNTIPVVKGSGLPPTASSTGAIEAMAMYAGESVASIHDIAPAAKVIDVICDEAERYLAHQ
jgi:nitronate monooxygenase